MTEHVREEASQPAVGDGEAVRNGVAPSAAEPPPPAPAQAQDKPATSRAEEAVDGLAVQVAVATSYVGKGLLRLAAICREHLSDIWAEAQDIRRGDKS
jgi:hypothetical protein